MKSKLVKTILLCIVSIFCFTGCIRSEAIVEYKINGKADITMVYATSVGDKEAAAAADEETNKQLEEIGWECKTYKQDGFEGFECTKRNVDIEDMEYVFNGAEELTQIGAESLSVTKNGNDYIVDWALIDEETQEQLKQYGPMFAQSGGYLRITMKFPNKPKQHNATEVSDNGKTLTWDVLSMEPGEAAHVEFSLSKVGVIIELALIITAIIIAIIAAVIIMKKLKKNKQQENYDMTEGPEVTDTLE